MFNPNEKTFVFRKRAPFERFWEILPGLQFWLVFFGAIFLSYFLPVWAALFIICFDLYWVLKAINVATHLITAHNTFQTCVKIDWINWANRLKNRVAFIKFLKNEAQAAKSRKGRNYIWREVWRLEKFFQTSGQTPPLEKFYHLILVPFVDETFEVLDSTFAALAQAKYPRENMLVILASEERAGAEALETAKKIKEKYQQFFYRFFITVHPDGLAGEIKGKSANASWAIKSTLLELEKLNIAIDQVLVSNFDSDTIVHPQYFARVIYAFLTAHNPYQKSFQPIAIYNNNIWDSPALIRVVSVSNSFWQFTESSRPDRLRTFSSHTMTLKALVDVGFWKKDIVNEDGFIFWQCYLRYQGDYQVVPLFIPISLDTCLAQTTWQTLKNQYKQKRRWAYNVEYCPHLIWPLLKSRAPFWDKIYKLYQYMESNFNWATASILISSLGWLPLFLGGDVFRSTVIGYNLPLATKTLMAIATFFLIFSVYVNLVLLPPRPKKYSPLRTAMMYMQWFLVPLTSVIFGSLPAIEAQTRLMFGKYLEFWVTPKARKGENTALMMKEMQTSNIPNPLS